MVDTTGQPLAGITLSLLDVQHADNAHGAFDNWYGEFKVTSAGDGSWTLPGVPLGSIATISLADARYAREQRNITLAADAAPAPVSFTAHPGARLTGRILTPEGTPATDALVSITVPGAASLRKTDVAALADGSYCFTGLAAGNYTITTRSKQQAWMADPLKDIALVEGQTDDRAGFARTRGSHTGHHRGGCGHRRAHPGN